MEKLKVIIDKTTKHPTIVNDDSKFVVVTYWWGRNVLNQNTARPCLEFHEKFFKEIIKNVYENLTVMEEKTPQTLTDANEKKINNIILSSANTYFKRLLKKENPTLFHTLIAPKVIKYYEVLLDYLDIKIKDKTKERRIKEEKDPQVKLQLEIEFQDEKIEKLLDKLPTIINEDKRAEEIHNQKQLGLPESERTVYIRKLSNNFRFYSREELTEIYRKLAVYAVLINRENILQYIALDMEINSMRSDFIKRKTKKMLKLTANTENDVESTIQNEESNMESLKTNIKEKTYQFSKKKDEITVKMMIKLKTKKASFSQADVDAGDIPEYYLDFFSNYTNSSIIDILNHNIRYVDPITFDQMIAKWEKECRDNNCNYLSVEYPEFTEPGGYQLAINAKPMFIEKALELCAPRSILYIDGDMYIRKYPHIFDMDNVDYMGRGWWMDPRSSWKMSESIMFDPYTFETSGGIMYFSQSFESKQLAKLWIEEAVKPHNQGKADDRVLSLIFNSRSLLCNMKIIQLPIEYLWLSLDYDDRMLDQLYDYVIPKMKETIFVEHPECLTSEDTASGAGASSSRTPPRYTFIEHLTPASEVMHEYLFFPNKEMTSAFRDYLDYMNSITYINDGNQDLIKKGLVHPAHPENNEQPLYVINYEDRYGNAPYFTKEIDEETGKLYTVNDIAAINESEINKIKLSRYNIIQRTIKNNKYYEINDMTNMRPKEVLRLILKLLSENKNVIYNPINSQRYISALYDRLIRNLDELYTNLDFVFFPIVQTFSRSDFYKPMIDLDQPILFRPGNSFFINYLKMFISLDDLSSIISGGAYELYSRTRIGYLKLPSELKRKGTKKTENVEITGGNKLYDKFLLDYENGLKYFYSDKNKIKKYARKTYKYKYRKSLNNKSRKSYRK